VDDAQSRLDEAVSLYDAASHVTLSPVDVCS
jgi:hypothetical protein